MKKMVNHSECCLKIGNDLWFASKYRNVVFKVNLQTRKTSVVSAIPHESYYAKRLIGKMELWHNEVVFVPARAKKIWIFNLLNYRWQSMDLEEAEKIIEEKFMASCVYNDRVFMFPCHYQSIVELDMKSKEIRYYKKAISEVVRKTSQINDCFFRSDIALIGNVCYLATCFSNAVLAFNLDTNSYKWYRVGNENDKFSGITYDGKYFWLAPRMYGDAIRWDGSNEDRYAINDFEPRTVMCFTGIVCDDDKRIIIPNLGYSFLYIKNNNEDVFTGFSNERCEAYLCKTNYTIIIRANGTGLYFDKDQKIDFQFNCDKYELFGVRFHDGQCVENSQMRLNDFLWYIKTD